MTTTITEYSATEQALAELRQKYEAVVFDVSTGKGLDQAKKARAELREHRVSLEKERVRIKAPALERCRQIDSEAKRITAELEALEEPIDQQIKAEEDRKAREKAAREEAERKRVEELRDRFNAIRTLPMAAVGKSSAEIAELVASAEQTDTESFPDDMKAAAAFELRLAVASLKAAQDAAAAAEAEAERIRAEREELERLRAEQAAVIAERERLHAEELARQAAEQKRVEDAARAEREAAERAAREAREEEQRRIDAERAERRRQEDAEREAAAAKLREEQAAAAAERKRLDDERKAAEKRERQQAIATATLQSAATEALELLTAEGFGEHLVTQKLAAALGREPVAAAA